MMYPMRFISIALALIVICSGCNRAPVRVNNVNVKEKKDVDPYRDALETFRQSDDSRAGDEWTRFRAGCDQLSRHYAKAEVVRSVSEVNGKGRAFLQAHVHLTEDESAEVESSSFRTADAHYLDECFLLYDAAKSLEVVGADKLEQAAIDFRWVMRNVMPHEQVDSWTPPAFTLRRGHGSPLERAMVFLALLRQSGIEGCLIAEPEPDPKNLLVAVLDAGEKDSRLYLFDPRLGMPLKGKDNKGILTLKDAIDEPALLQPAAITPDEAKKLEAWLVCPLYALSGRAMELERGLRGRHPITLHLDAAWLKDEIGKATTQRVQIWNPKAKDKLVENSPTRCLRTFLPKQEGGSDETGRTIRYVRALVPAENILHNFAQIGIKKELMPKLAFDMLFGISVDFFNKYHLRPHEMQLRGQFQSVFRRQERLQLFTRNDALIGLVGDRVFEEDCKNWRKQVNDLAAAGANEDPRIRAKAQANLQNLLGQDQFIRWLIEINKEEEFDAKKEITVLARILAVGMRERLESELGRSQATVSFEKADHSQALLRNQKDMVANDLAGVRAEWSVAKDALENFYLNRTAVDSIIDQQLKRLPFVERQNPLDHLDKQIGLLETLHLDLHKYFQARLRLAECLEYLGEPKAAAASLQTTKAQIEAMETKGQMAAEIKKLREHPFAKAAPIFHERLDLLARDWSPTGNYYWLKQHIDRTIK